MLKSVRNTVFQTLLSDMQKQVETICLKLRVYKVSRIGSLEIIAGVIR